MLMTEIKINFYYFLGLSCLNGLFEEHGPIYMDMKTYKIKKRDRAWTKKYHVLYLDQTIHCGYSFSLINETSSTLEETGIRIYHALRKFLLVFPEMQNRYLYLTGQFDSSKYITIACKENLATENPKSRMNIKGLMIGIIFSSIIIWLEHSETSGGGGVLP